MKACILAAGVGQRMGDAVREPKSLLRFGGRTLLARHLELLAERGVDSVVLGVGHRADLVEAEVARAAPAVAVQFVHNPDYRGGSVLTLAAVLPALEDAGEVLLMDADVLYDRRLLARLAGSAHSSCFLLDRDFVPGDEPVKLCVRDGRLVEFRKQVAADLAFDYMGESVGFFKLAPDTLAALAERVQGYLDRGLRDAPYEEPLRDLLLAEPGRFGFEDVTGLPWIELDFPEDLDRARESVLPRLADAPESVAAAP